MCPFNEDDLEIREVDPSELEEPDFETEVPIQPEYRLRVNTGTIIVAIIAIVGIFSIAGFAFYRRTYHQRRAAL